MMNKINELCYAYQDYGEARARKDWDAVKAHSANMARLRAEVKRMLMEAGK